VAGVDGAVDVGPAAQVVEGPAAEDGHVPVLAGRQRRQALPGGGGQVGLVGSVHERGEHPVVAGEQNPVRGGIDLPVDLGEVGAQGLAHGDPSTSASPGAPPRRRSVPAAAPRRVSWPWGRPWTPGGPTTPARRVSWPWGRPWTPGGPTTSGKSNW